MFLAKAGEGRTFRRLRWRFPAAQCARMAVTPVTHTLAGISQQLASGDRGTRTPNLGIANAALSQLSYIPTRRQALRL